MEQFEVLFLGHFQLRDLSPLLVLAVNMSSAVPNQGLLLVSITFTIKLMPYGNTTLIKNQAML